MTEMTTAADVAAPATRELTVTVNGDERSAEVEPRLLLVHFLRQTLGLTGTHIGCDTTSCGACTVLLDGTPVNMAPFGTASRSGRVVRCTVRTPALSARRRASAESSSPTPRPRADSSTTTSWIQPRRPVGTR